MNRDFEIRQLLRAFRSGIMSEAAFEEEMASLEHEGTVADSGQPASPPFEVGGRVYRSEREAVLTFLDELHANEMDSAVGFARWAAVCQIKGLRTGLLIAAERSAYHARVIQRRMHELGADPHAATTERGGRMVEVLGNNSVSDLEKLSALTAAVQDPRQAVAPLLTFATALKRDVETQQALHLLADDELSTATWLREVNAAFARPTPTPANDAKPQ